MGTKPEWWDSAKARIVEACEHGGRLEADEIHRGVFGMSMDGRFESPIEAIFAAWWYAVCRYTAGRDIWLSPQHEVICGIDRYRLDFTVSLDVHPGSYGSGVLNDYPKVGIELDGHDFHERTKEQVTYRNRRDRALQMAGWKVFHVSGSELYRDPERCVTEVVGAISCEFSRFWSDYWDAVNSKRAAERAAANQVGALTSQES